MPLWSISNQLDAYAQAFLDRWFCVSTHVAQDHFVASRLNDALKPLAGLQLLETDEKNERLSVVGLTRTFTNARRILFLDRL